MQEVITDSDYVLWIKLCKTFTKLEDDIIFGCTYIPPLSSRFYNNDKFEKYESEVSQMTSRYNLVYMFGDFNSQVAELEDFTSSDDFLNSIFDIDINVVNYINQKQLLQYNNVPLFRKSEDKKTNMIKKTKSWI